MTLSIAPVLRELRRDHNTTQEQLAAHLGVTAQAISRWEAGTGYPDIETLPEIADYFGVTVDALLGLDRPARAARLRDIHARIALSGERAGLGEELLLLSEARDDADEFPADEVVQLNLADALCRVHLWADEPNMTALREAERIYRGIIDRTADDDHRSAAISALGTLYVQGMKDIDRAIAVTERLPSIRRTREWRLAKLLPGKEGIPYRQRYMVIMAHRLIADLRDYTAYQLDNSRARWDEKVEMFEALIALTERIFGESADFASLTSSLYRYIATYRVAQGRLDDTLDVLEAAVRYAVIESEAKPGEPGKTPYTDRLVSGCDLFGNIADEVHNDAWYLLEKLEGQDRYDPLRGEARFAAICERLRGVAK